MVRVHLKCVADNNDGEESRQMTEDRSRLTSFIADSHGPPVKGNTNLSIKSNLSHKLRKLHGRGYMEQDLPVNREHVPEVSQQNQSFNATKVTPKGLPRKPKKIKLVGENFGAVLVHRNQRVKEVYSKECPENLSKKSIGAPPRYSRKRGKLSCLSGTQENSHGSRSQVSAKRRKLTSEESDKDGSDQVTAFEDKYPSHFSSDSDDSIDSEMITNRK